MPQSEEPCLFPLKGRGGAGNHSDVIDLATYWDWGDLLVPAAASGRVWGALQTLLQDSLCVRNVKHALCVGNVTHFWFHNSI